MIKKGSKYFNLLRIDTYGWIATASAIICIISGVFLTIPYDISNPYVSVTRLVTHLPFASFTRNLHYWSAQWFLIFTILHIYDHLKKAGEKKIPASKTWLILTISSVFSGYVMISGFILKGDADALQARRIIATVLNTIPVLGKLFSETFIGSQENLINIYIHHIATATIILIFAIYEHTRSVSVNLKTWLTVLVSLLLISLFFQAPIEPGNSNLIKGPWYFVGFQEILHQTTNPEILAIAFIFVLLIFFLIYFLTEKYKKLSKFVLLSIAIIYLVFTIVGLFFRGENWKLQTPWQTGYRINPLIHYAPIRFFQNERKVFMISGRVEGCLSCHSEMSGLTESHNPKIIGCYNCHLGNPFTINKYDAHQKMILIPGNLSNAQVSCGTNGCHPEIVNRVSSSLMATLRGMVNVDRFVFDEQKTPDGYAEVKNITNSAADIHLKNLCVTCHTGSEKINPGDPDFLERGGGCNACHLTYSRNARTSLAWQKSKFPSKEGNQLVHPSIDLKITNDKCLSCHSRSGRISMSYEGWHETTLTKEEINGKNKVRILPDQRVFEFVEADVHHKIGMLCIDCHGSYELMGDGNRYFHKEEAVDVQCDDCHIKTSSRVKYQAALDNESRLIAWLRGNKDDSAKVVITGRKSFPLMSTFESNDRELWYRNSQKNKLQEIKPQIAACSRGKGHSDLSCGSCHTAWVPQCIGCHNSYDPDASGYDMLKKENSKGSWIEYAGLFLNDPPVLGIRETQENSKQVITFAPGMALSIDAQSFDKEKTVIWKRLFAPVSGHTTIRESRSCKSCHNNPLAIGYGRGELIYNIKNGIGQWKFEPQFENNKYDGLPEDAWIGFLTEPGKNLSTRYNTRPFNLKEQKKILTVGACLTCHNQDSHVMRNCLSNMTNTILHKSDECLIPDF